MKNKILLIAISIGPFFVAVGCGDHPLDIKSDRDIKQASKNVERIRIGLLPIKEYPALARLENVKDVDFFTMDGTGANDAKLKAFAELEWPKLEQVCLLNCPAVTDAGIRQLSNISSLQGFQLEGTSISDKSLAILTKSANLKGINVANCRNVTANGLFVLVEFENLEELTFSVGSMTEDEVIQIVRKLKNVKYLGIIDPDGKVREERVELIGNEKGIAISISQTGALQDVISQ